MARFWKVLTALIIMAVATRQMEAAMPGGEAEKSVEAMKASGSPELSATSPMGGGIENAQREKVEDPCTLAETTANPTRPAWDFAASTTQCGVLETDYGFLDQSMGSGVVQRMLVTSVRYGLTPKLDLRFGLTNHIAQSGGTASPLEGVGDDWFSGRYRFREQGKTLPALAFMYGVKIPMANPVKGFGTGFVDHQFLLIASRDVGRNHFDFNSVGTLAGSSHQFDGASQYGLALTRPMTKKLSAILESYGGSQPGSTDRFGAGFAGATYAVRPALVIDGAFTRTYTAGAPRQQALFGITFARRAGFAPLPRSSSFARLLGR